MIVITYLTSFFFNSEAIAQNFLILFNLVFGSLGSTVVIMLRAIDETTKVAKIVAYFIRIIPSFAFGYGYNLLLNGKLIMFIDYSIGYLTKPASTYISLESLFLGCTFVVYIICIIIIECNAYSVEEVDDGLLPRNEDIELDKQVEKEIKKANKINDGSEDGDIYAPNNKNKKNKNTYTENLEDLLDDGNPDSDKNIVLNVNVKNNRKDTINENKTKDNYNTVS